MNRWILKAQRYEGGSYVQDYYGRYSHEPTAAQIRELELRGYKVIGVGRIEIRIQYRGGIG